MRAGRAPCNGRTGGEQEIFCQFDIANDIKRFCRIGDADADIVSVIIDFIGIESVLLPQAYSCRAQSDVNPCERACAIICCVIADLERVGIGCGVNADNSNICGVTGCSDSFIRQEHACRRPEVDGAGEGRALRFDIFIDYCNFRKTLFDAP